MDDANYVHTLVDKEDDKPYTIDMGDDNINQEENDDIINIVKNWIHRNPSILLKDDQEKVKNNDIVINKVVKENTIKMGAKSFKDEQEEKRVVMMEQITIKRDNNKNRTVALEKLKNMKNRLYELM